MNEEIYKECTKWEKVFHNALKINFLRLSMDEWNKIALLYEQHFNKKIRPNERGCNNCRLRIVKEIGKAYFEEKKMQEEIAKKKKIEEEAKKKIEIEIENTKKKRRIGRPRKINLDGTEK